MARGEMKAKLSQLGQEVQKRQRLSQLRRDTLRKIAFTKRKATIEPADTYILIKEFFKHYLEQPYEFTIGELREELKNTYLSSATRSRIAKILDDLHKIEYASVTLTHKELHKLLDEFNLVVQEMVHTRRKSTSLLGRLRAFFLREDEESEVVITDLPVLQHEDARGAHVRLLVEKCYIALDAHKMRQAKRAYGELLAAYNTMPERERETHYPLIDQTYRDILNRAHDLEQT